MDARDHLKESEKKAFAIPGTCKEAEAEKQSWEQA